MTTILIVDDRRDAIEAIQSRLENNGFVVVSTGLGSEALAICKQRDIDAVIMDLNMPEVDGCDATEQLRADEATAKIPIVICTAQPMDGDRERAFESGCDHFIEKPIDLGQLLDALSDLLELASSAELPAEQPTDELHREKDIPTNDLLGSNPAPPLPGFANP